MDKLLSTASVHLIDPDVSRRAAISRLLYMLGIHAEIYEGVWEFAARVPLDGVVLAYDSKDECEAFELFEMLKSRARHLSLVMYATAASVEGVVRALKSGANAYLQWPFAADEVLRTVSGLARQDSSERKIRARVAEATEAVKRLSPREIQVLLALIEGSSNKDIARSLEISPRTVEIHRANMMTKLEAQSTADAIRIGIYAGLDRQPHWSPERSYPRLGKSTG